MRRWIIITLIALVVAGTLLELPDYLQQWLWMRQLNYTGIFWTLISVQYAMFAVAFVFAFLFLWINIRQAIRTSTASSWAAPRRAIPPQWGGGSLEQPDILTSQGLRP
jgi:uncharacterized membrane protein (UPF0182 family)